ncbi:MAG: phosphoglycerate dehydrogenase [Candidatus Neomarinimicrobiota bacterium]
MKVLVTDPIDEFGIAILRDSGIDVATVSFENREELLRILPEADGWILRSGTTVTADLLEKAERLKVIGRAGVGVDNIDLKAATHRGVVVMNTPGVNTVSAAEHSIALTLTLLRNVHKGYASLREGRWDRHLLVGRELQNKTLGVVGLGKVGTAVIKRLRPFGMTVLGYDPYVKMDRYELDYLEFVDLDDLCKRSDIVTLHIPATETTRRMFDINRLKTMRSSAVIINCARGGIIVEEDLRKALDEGIIAGAAVDVFEDEPAKGSPLLSARNILFTPHLGASTTEAKAGVTKAVCQQVRNFLIDGSAENAVNLPISDLSLLDTLQPHLDLAEKLGSIQQQLVPGAAEKITVETQGTLTEVKLVTLGFLKGFLEKIHGSTVNIVNAAAVAESHGIQVQETYSHGESDYANVVSTTVTSGDYSLKMKGSLFSDKHPRVIYYDGFHVDVNPKGNMLIVHNKDVPGVVGKVGTFLGNSGINIAGYQLSRKSDSKLAFGLIRLDEPLGEEALGKLARMEEIISVRQLIL